MIELEPDAIEQMRACQRALDDDPQLRPYIGPEQILRRFQAGEIVTAADCLVDQSLWIVEAIHHRAAERLQWMLRPMEVVPMMTAPR